VWTVSKINALMRAIDRDGNGKVDYDEFVRWMMAGPEFDTDRKSMMTLGESAAKAEQKDAKSPEKEAAGDSAGQKEVDEVLDTLFALYDEDGDEQIERIELLDGEERRIGKTDFGPKERKAVINWFKAAGAEGTPIDGMFLSKEKWKAAMVQLAATESGSNAAAEPGKLAAWLRENRLAPLEAAMPKPAAPAAAPSGGGGEATAAPATPPTYPLTAPFKELEAKVKEAASFQKSVLILASGLEEVETWMSYKMTSLVDCKMIINETLVKKSKSKEDAQAEVRTKLTQAMNSSGFCKPLHIRLNNSAFDWNSFCGQEVPADIFDPTVWTVGNAFKRGFFDEGHKFSLEIEDGKKWKDFYVVMTSTFNLEQATEHLTDKIPGYNGLAIIVVDPASVA